MKRQSDHVFLSPDEVDERLNEATILDTRRPEAYRAGHLPGAVNIPFERIRDPSSVTPGMLPEPEAFAELFSENGISESADIIAYDGDHGSYAARFLLTAFVYGHEGNLQLLDGDISVWERAYETETEIPTLDPVTYDAEPLSDPPIADKDAVSAASEGETVLVDTRSPEEFEQAHIPNAIQLGWGAFIDSTGRLRPKSSIREELTERGIAQDTDVLLYCNTARRLSYTYAVLTELGYDDVRFYEGSLTEWVRAESPTWDPENLYADVKRVASGGFDALTSELGEDIFSRLHLVGLYTYKQDDHFMLRTKIPGGRLTAEQARTLGTVADEFARAPEQHGGENQNPIFGDGFLDITTRQGIQMHWIAPADVPEIWDRFESVGLTTLQASGNTLRNVVACPGDEVAETELDVQSLAESIAETFEGRPRFANLPRKLKVSVGGCGSGCSRPEIQDLGFVPARKGDRIGYHAKVGGGLSDGPRIATDLGIFLEPEQVPELAIATAELFIEHGSYLDTAINRLRYLVKEWGEATFREELQRFAPFQFESAGTAISGPHRNDHVGLEDQGDGSRFVGLTVPTGRMTGEDFIRLADIADRFGSGELRLTPNQNVAIPNVPADAVDSLTDQPLLERYRPDPGPFTRGIVTCTGSEFCDYGIVETKSRGLQWARELDEWVAESVEDPPEVFRTHMSGCSASCAQPQIASVGLRGETHRSVDGTNPAFDVGVGGNLERNQFINWKTNGLPVEAVPRLLRQIVTESGGEIEDYLNRKRTEPFAELVGDSERSISGD